MPQSSLVVGHGGHGTAMRALAHDVPLLVLPLHSQLDHPMVGKVVEAAGAGRTVPKSARPERLREVIAVLLGDGPHRAAAAALGEQVRRADGAASAATMLEELLRRQPSPTTAQA